MSGPPPGGLSTNSSGCRPARRVVRSSTRKPASRTSSGPSAGAPTPATVMHVALIATPVAIAFNCRPVPGGIIGLPRRAPSLGRGLEPAPRRRRPSPLDSWEPLTCRERRRGVAHVRRDPRLPTRGLLLPARGVFGASSHSVSFFDRHPAPEVPPQPSTAPDRRAECLPEKEVPGHEAEDQASASWPISGTSPGHSHRSDDATGAALGDRPPTSGPAGAPGNVGANPQPGMAVGETPVRSAGRLRP